MKKVFLKSIKLYQKFISPYTGNVCRFYPCCSDYSYQAIKKYGLAKGLFFTIKRILKCHPWNQGGVNFP